MLFVWILCPDMSDTIRTMSNYIARYFDPCMYTYTIICRISMASITATSVTTTCAAAVRRSSVVHSSAVQVQSRAQHLPSLTQAHKTRVQLHVPSALPTLPQKQQVSRIRKPAGPACLREHSLTSEGKPTKKVIISPISTLDYSTLTTPFAPPTVTKKSEHSTHSREGENIFSLIM